MFEPDDEPSTQVRRSRGILKYTSD